MRTTTRRTSRSTRPARPRQYVLWLLGQREWSAKELMTRLLARGCSAEEAEDAIAHARSLGLQSDERFAGVKARAESRRKGDRSVRYALATQGIDAEQVAAEIAALEPETERVIGAVRRFEGRPADLKLKARVWRFLAGRGFSPAAIDAAFAHLAGSSRPDASGEATDDDLDDGGFSDVRDD